jgi:hypothetical protein
VIGDIHGHADELVTLLERLGYSEAGGVFRHPDRQAVFCGDFIDRGPQIRDTIHIVRNMVEHHAARAVMGNHEFNAVAFHTERPDQPGKWYRPHTQHSTQQHQATLEQLSDVELQEALDWFRGLPIALDLGGIRVVHACWDPKEISRLQNQLQKCGRCDALFLEQAADRKHPLGMAIERVLKGPEVVLPDNTTVIDKEGHARRRVRIRWFESPQGHNLGSYAFPNVPRLEDVPVPATAVPSPYPQEAPPLFIGHYWLDSRHDSLPRPNLACLDLSVAKSGHLCAYRFHGESVLNRSSFVTIPARNSLTVG